MLKTNKSYTKRIKVTKNGKLKARKPGRNHFNSRQSGSQRLAKRQMQTITMSSRARNRFLANA